jgi:hypothetical protein
MKSINFPRCVLARMVAAGIALQALGVQAQSTSLLQIHTIEVVPGSPPEFVFADQGTGATNYTVEFSPAVGASWSIIAGAVITGLGGGNYRVVAPDPQNPLGFYRVRGNGGAVIASFVTTAFQVTEGGMVAPTITFNAPFFGTLRYTVSGTAATGDYVALSGEVRVNGTTATIPVTLLENAGIGQLKHLTLSLTTGPGYRLGSSSQTTIVIDENDAEWPGTFSVENAGLTFVLKIQQTAGGHLATLKSDGFGFFPTNELPAVLTFTESTFAATIQNIPVAPGASLLDSAMSLGFLLRATNGQPNQTVSSTQVQGAATLITEVSGKPYLNTTNRGTFLLLKPRVAPSTNQVELVRTP